MSTPNLGALSIRVLLNTSQMEGEFNRKMRYLAYAGGAVLAAQLGSGLLGAFKKGLDGAKELESQLARLSTIASQVEMKNFTAGSVLKLSNELGIAVKELTEAQYLALSSGVAAADVNRVVGDSAKFAISQNVELKTGIDAVTSALNAYSATGLTSAKATDIFTAAAKDGKGSVDQFSKYISIAIPIASQLGAPLEQIAALGAASTRTGKTARVAFTGLKVAMQELSDSSKGGGKVFKEIFKEDFQSYIARTGDLNSAFRDFTKEVGAKNLTNIFGAKEGAAALQQLATTGTEVLNGIVQNAATAGGATASAFEKIENTAAYRAQRAGVAWQNMLTRLGAYFTDFRSRVILQFQEIVDRLTASIEGGGAAIQLKVNEILGFFTGLATNIAASLGQLNFGALLGVLQTLGVAVGAVLTPFVLLLNNLGPLVAVLNVLLSVLNFLSPVLGGIVVALGAYLVVTKAIAIAVAAQVAITSAVAFVTGIYTAAAALAAAGTGGFTAAVTALTVAMLANPVGLVIGLIVGLAAALVLAWKKSETFREIVVGTFNAIKNTVLTAVQIMMNVYAGWVTLVLTGFQKILSGLGHLPKWLGGGSFDSAAGAVQNLINGVNAIKSSLNGLIDRAKAANWELQSMAQAATKATLARWMNGTLGEGQEESPAPLLAPSAPMSSSGGGGGSYTAPAKAASKGVSASATAAKAAAQKIAEAVKKLSENFKDLRKNITTLSVEQIGSTFDGIYKGLEDANKRGLKKVAVKAEKEILKYAKQRDAVVAKLDLAKDSLKALTDQAKSFRDSLISTTVSLGNMTGSQGWVTFLSITDRLRLAIATTNEFAAAMSALTDRGLNNATLEQLAQAGPAAGLAAARALLEGGQTGVAEVNALQAQLETAAGSLATKTSSTLYDAGIQAAQGLVAGLQSQEAALTAMMQRLADKMVAQLKKSLKIKSPSQVMAEEIGMPTGQGILKGALKGANGFGALSDSLVSDARGAGSGGGGTVVEIHATGPTLQDIVKVQMRESNRISKSRATAGSSFGAVSTMGA